MFGSETLTCEIETHFSKTKSLTKGKKDDVIYSV